MTLTILEGPDGSGKTTFGRQLAIALGDQTKFDHHGPYEGVADPTVNYFTSIQRALYLTRHVVMDRSWLSEPVYGSVYRDGGDRVGVAKRRMLERAALSAGAVVAFFLPPMSWSCANWMRNRENEYLQTARDAANVYTEYLDFIVGVKRTDLPWVVVNPLIHPFSNAVGMIESVRPPENRGPGAGRWGLGAKVVLVGDRVDDDHHDCLPFTRFDGVGSSTWLAEQLESANVSESDLYWVNRYDHALQRDTDPSFFERLAPKKVVALGAKAETWCREVAQLSDFEAVDHPQRWKRFHFHEPYPLLDVLKEVLRA